LATFNETTIFLGLATSVIFVNENENENEKDQQFVHKNENYTVSGKKGTNSILGIISSNTGRFSQFFQYYNLQEICN